MWLRASRLRLGGDFWDFLWVRTSGAEPMIYLKTLRVYKDPQGLNNLLLSRYQSNVVLAASLPSGVYSSGSGVLPN